MKNSERLRKGLERLGPNGEHWIKGSWAKDGAGNEAWPTDTTACSFCSMGVLVWVGKFSASVDLLGLTLGHNVNIPAFNDAPETTFEDVKAKFLEAIALAEKEEALSEAQ